MKSQDEKLERLEKAVEKLIESQGKKSKILDQIHNSLVKNWRTTLGGTAVGGVKIYHGYTSNDYMAITEGLSFFFFGAAAHDATLSGGYPQDTNIDGVANNKL